MGIELVPSALRAHSRQEMCILSIVSGLQFCRNVGEDFSRNPLHSIVQSAVYGKRQRLETFRTNLLIPDDVAFISSKCGADMLGDGKVTV